MGTTDATRTQSMLKAGDEANQTGTWIPLSSLRRPPQPIQLSGARVLLGALVPRRMPQTLDVCFTGNVYSYCAYVLLYFI